MLQTRRVNTYGRRSTAIVSAPNRLLPPTRESRRAATPDSPASETNSLVVSESPPSRTRVQKSTTILKSSIEPSIEKVSPKKENLVAELSVLSISSPPATKLRKRKQLLVSSPKFRGSPKQRRLDRHVSPLASVSSILNSPLRPRKPIIQKHKQHRDQTVIISDDESYHIPGGYPPMRPARRLSPIAAVRSYRTAGRAHISAPVGLDEPDLDDAPPLSSRHPTLQPLVRQNAMFMSPPIRHRTGPRLSGGSTSMPRLNRSIPLANPPSPRSASPSNDLPSPIDSDDEVAFMDVVAQLEAKPVSVPAPVRTWSEPTIRPDLKPALAVPTLVASNGLSLNNAQPSTTSLSQLRSLPTSTASLSLSLPKRRPSTMSVVIPIPRNKTKSIAKLENPLDQTGSHHTQSTPSESSKLLVQARSNKQSCTDAKLKPIKDPKPVSTKQLLSQPEPNLSSSIPKHHPRASMRPRAKSQSSPSTSQLSQPVSSYTPALQSLLSTCSQSDPIDLDVFVATFSTDEVHDLYPSVSRRWRKVGEASYSEVFALGGVVVKVIPLRMEGTSEHESEDEPFVSEAGDVEKEIAVTRAMGEIQDGFIKLIKAHVARGPYSKELLDLWDAYNRETGSESVRPGCFSSSQLYVLLILPDGGLDLEHYSFTHRTSWRTAFSIFWQVARTLAHAEKLVRFEHRDLHWGQVLVQNVPKTRSKSKSKMEPPVRVTLIDLGMSRMDTHTQKAWYTEIEPEVFEGKGDYQFDVYRMMKAHCLGKGERWDAYKPLTNVMWLHYLVHQLLTAKGLRKPDTHVSRYHTAEDVQAESWACTCLAEMEKILGTAVTTTGGPRVAKAGGNVLKRSSRRANDLDMQRMENAIGVMRWGAQMGWVEALDSLD